MTKSENVFIPPCITSDSLVFFAIDNSDLKIDTADGKGQLYGTAISIYQQNSVFKQKVTLPIERNSMTSKSNKSDYCQEPKWTNHRYLKYEILLDQETYHMYQNYDTIWMLMKTLNNSFANDVLTWSAHNSLGVEQKSNFILRLANFAANTHRLVKPSSCNNVAKRTKTQVSPSKKTIIFLDLQARDDIGRKFVFRVGELHVVFCLLKTIGKCIDASDLPTSLVQAGIYGSTTIEQVMSGKHVCRSFEAFLTLYLALYKVYSAKLIKQNTLIERDLRGGVIEAIVSLDGHRTMNKEQLQSIHRNFLAILESIDFVSIQSTLDNSLNYQATRQKIWGLHLVSLHELVKYFFAYDMKNYARLTPVYLAQMFALKDNDKETWDFSVNKSCVPFSAIGGDHAIERENRSFKVLGGIKMSSKRDEHHGLTGSKNQRITENVKKLSTVFDAHNTNFEEFECVYNTIISQTRVSSSRLYIR